MPGSFFCLFCVLHLFSTALSTPTTHTREAVLGKGDGRLCELHDPNGYIRTEDDVQLVTQACRDSAQYFERRRARFCEHADALAFKVTQQSVKVP